MSDCSRGYCKCLDAAVAGNPSLSDLRRAVRCPNTDEDVARLLSELMRRRRVVCGEQE